MRTGRVKASNGGIYLIASNTIGLMPIFANLEERERFIKLLDKAARFSCVTILNYRLENTGFYLTGSVPERKNLTEEEVMERIKILYLPKEVKAIERKWERLREMGQEYLEEEIDRYRKRMFDLSEFVKTLKSHFTNEYNRANDHYGTIWCSRFDSTLIDDSAIPQISAFIGNKVDWGLSPMSKMKRVHVIMKGKILGRKEFVKRMISEHSECFGVYPKKRVVWMEGNDKIYASHGSGWSRLARKVA